MAPAAVEDRAAEDERPEISPVDDPEIEDERPPLSPVDDPEEDDVDRPKSYTEQLREIKRERDELRARDRAKQKEKKAVERKKKRTMDYVRNCSVQDLLEAITEKNVTRHSLAILAAGIKNVDKRTIS